MSESETMAATQPKQQPSQTQQQQQQQQQTSSSSSSMPWQYGQNNMHLYNHFTPMFSQNYAHQSQMYYQHYNMMGLGQYGSTAQAQSQQSSEQKRPPPPLSSMRNQTTKSQQSPLSQQSLQNQQSRDQQSPYNSYPYNSWSSANQSDSNNFSGVRFNLPSKKAGLGFIPLSSNNANNANNVNNANKKKRKKNKNGQDSFDDSFPSGMPNMSLPPPNFSPNMFKQPPPPLLQTKIEMPPLPPPMEKPPTPPPIDDIEMPPEPPLPKMLPIDVSRPPPPLPSQMHPPKSKSPPKPLMSLKPQITQPPPSPSPVKQAPNPVGDWPDSLKNFVNRCYEKCKTPVDKDQVEIILKGKITRAANDGSLWVRDWDREPLPLIHSERNSISIKPFSVSGSPVGQRKSGGMMPLGARLGLRNPFSNTAGNTMNSNNSSHNNSIHRRSKSRSRSNSRSPSPTPRKYRRSTSSSSGERDYKQAMPNNQHQSQNQKSKKAQRQMQNQNQNANNKQSKKNKNANKQKINKANCHFYSEHGLTGGNVEEFGTKEKLQQRAARFSGPSQRSKPVPQVSSSVVKPASSVQRSPFAKPVTQITSMIRDDPTAEFDFTGLHIVGTCRDLEKPYLRLTSAPAASAVRPVCVLEKSLSHVKKRWLTKQDYRYTCDQLKSIRQDLTVQGIRDSFTVHVYETHARVALERGDHEEFNQCQTQLRMLYTEIGGENRCEFVAYRILYYIFTKNNSDLTTILAALTEQDKKDECVRHALKVRSAWWLRNFHSFFNLYKKAPKMAAFLMDWFIARERKLALKQMIKVYRPNLAVEFIVAELAFESSEKFYEFAAEFSLAYAEPERQQLDCKTSSATVGAW
ncbi:hypothetical protein QAD02_019006 [Eretmocerus hayati]|uniref:Uncharacterized protein n=1 Tax=Eretmocerus hayati TaxID=131215 RepID=A0ACC2PHZ6_9HYME|nr:hypothetical protein QAD02_019006 [Eretmocerus hayati]